jgi:flavin-binding protein dodecin
MSVAKVIEIISKSKLSFDDAIKQGVARASETVSGVAGAWVKDQSVTVANGKVTEYCVTLKVTFVLKAAGGSKGKSK